jgi:hypothetical protein
MRPLIITPLYLPAVGGAATYFGSIVPDLAARPEIGGLTVVTERLPGEPAERTAGKRHILRQLPRHESPHYSLEPHRPERVVSDLVRLCGRVITSAACAGAGPVSDPAGDRVA